VILSAGAVPLDVLETNFGRWLALRGAGSPAGA
jgi:hypothetical protein